MSKDGEAIVYRILCEISGCKYLYKSIVEGAIAACIENYGLKPAEESNDEICTEVLRILNNNT